MKTILTVIFLFIPCTAMAGTAYWTGKFEYLGEEKNTALWGCYYKDSEGKQKIKIMEMFCHDSIVVDINKGQGSKGKKA